MVADALIYHPSVAHYLRFAATTAGRDKLLGTIQYFARFYAWYLYRTNGSPAEVAPWSAVKSQFGQARKLLGVGKNVEHLKAAASAADSKNMDPVLRYAAVGRQLSYAAYLSWDVLALPDLLGIRKWKGAKEAQRRAAMFWVLALVFSLVGQAHTMFKLGEREARLDKKDGEDVVESRRIAGERAACRLQLLSDLCDLTIPTSTLGWANFDDGFVGLAGTVSNLIGLQLQWKKTA